MKAAAWLALPARAAGRLEQWFVHRPLRFVASAVALSVLWAALLPLLVPAPAIERALGPVLGPRSLAGQLLHVLVAAPLLENALLWLVFRATAFALPPRDSRLRTVGAVALPAAAFSIAHYPFKELFGAEVFGLGCMLVLCFLWGRRHARAWRAYALSVAVHFGVNLLAVGLFHL